MSLKRVGILLGKEFWQSPKNFIFVWAVAGPIVLSLVVSLAFGTLFTDKPKLGIMDEGSSQLVTMFKQSTSVITKEYGSISEIRQAVESGAVDIGMVLPHDFDGSVTRGEEIEVTAYVWGESLAKNRIILEVTILNLVRELAGHEAPVEIVAITLGGDVSVPWSDRLLPFIVLMAVFMGGLLLPGMSVINEKEKKTLEGLVVTPATIGDVFVAKGLLGVILSLVMGVAILVLNRTFGAEPGILLLVLALGAIMAAELGLLLGALVKDTTTLFAVWKFGGMLLFGPALLYMFPKIPEWIGKMFPTYYFIQPIVEISQGSGGWADVATNVFILVALDLILIAVVAFTLRRTQQHAV
ncbi:MAG: ABC transporter permease [Dehalococcoidia bacterium]|nr:ABC transporter permease [Dehalococcoidia bacterium]